MLRIFILNLLFCSVAFSGDLLIEDFSGNTNCEWKPCKWGHHENTSYKVGKGKITLNYGKIKKGKKSGFAFYAKLKQQPELNNYKYLWLKARSGSQENCSMQVYVQREQPAGKNSSFYSIIQLTPKWKTYNLRLKNTHRSMAGKGFFVKTKADSGASRQLESGGKLKCLTFYSKNAKSVEIVGIELKEDDSQNKEKNKVVIEAIKKHKKYSPYQFKEIISKNGPVLIDDGKSSFVIYADKETGITGKFAAVQLMKYIKKSTGTGLKIVDKYPADKKVIQLSVNSGSNQKEGFKTEALSSSKILICGNDERGLLYGVYDFLEKAFGIRWLAPFDYAEVIPHQKTVKLPLWRDESSPRMLYRRFHYCSAGRGVPKPMEHRYNVADWCVKNRYNVELERLVSKYDSASVKKTRMDKIKEFYAKRGGYIALPTMWGHNYHYWVSPKKYFKTNPKYFCYESSTGKWRAERAQLCATNPDVVKIIIKRAVEYFKKYPEREYFPLFQEDGSRLWCQCPKCQKLYKDGNMNGYKTEHNINLANNVAIELNKIIPGKKVATYAYSVTSQPPVHVKPNNNVFVTYCLMDFSNPDKFPWRGFYGEELSAWSKLCNGNLILYTYNYLDFYYTANTSKSLIRTFRYFNLEKIKCSCQESNENWYGVSAYNYYLSARLAWNPWFNTKEFRKDYYEKFYGKAAKYIDKYHSLLEECLSNKKYWLEYGNRTLPHIPAEKLKIMEQCLEEAQTAVKDYERPNTAVRAQCNGFTYVKAFSEAVVAGAEFQKSTDESKYHRVLNSLTKLEKIIKQLAPYRLVPILALRQTKGMRRNMRENYMRSNALKNIKKEYQIIKELPATWNFKTDPANEGEKDKWFSKSLDDSRWRKIKTGNWWSNQGLKSYLGTAWYRTNITVPASKKDFALYFCGVDERAWIYLNGRYIGGHHKGEVKKLWNEPFLIKLPKDTKSGQHQLTVKVHASAGKGGIWKPVFLMAKK